MFFERHCILSSLSVVSLIYFRFAFSRCFFVTDLKMKPNRTMKKLVVILSLMLASAYGFSQESTEQAKASVKSDSTKVETTKEVSKDSTVAALGSTRAVIESNFDKASFLYRGRKSKSTQLC